MKQGVRRTARLLSRGQDLLPHLRQCPAHRRGSGRDGPGLHRARSIRSAGFTVADVRGRVGDRYVLMGGVNTMSFVNSSPDEIHAEALRCIAEGNGAFVLGSGCAPPKRHEAREPGSPGCGQQRCGLVGHRSPSGTLKWNIARRSGSRAAPGTYLSGRPANGPLKNSIAHHQSTGCGSNEP